MTDLSKLMAITSSVMLLSDGYVEPQSLISANNTMKATHKATKNRVKIKAARK